MNKKIVAYYIATLTLLAIALAAVLVFIPGVSSLKTKKQKLVDQQTELKALKEKGSALKQMEEDYKSIQKDIEQVSKYLPTKKEMSDIVIQLETAANNSGVALKNIKASQSSTGGSNNKAEDKITDKSKSQLVQTDNLYELPLQLTTEGNFSSVLGFLEQIENLSRYISIEVSSIKILSDEETGGMIEAVFDIKAYVKD